MSLIYSTPAGQALEWTYVSSLSRLLPPAPSCPAGSQVLSSSNALSPTSYLTRSNGIYVLCNKEQARGSCFHLASIYILRKNGVIALATLTLQEARSPIPIKSSTERNLRNARF